MEKRLLIGIVVGIIVLFFAGYFLISKDNSKPNFDNIQIEGEILSGESHISAESQNTGGGNVGENIVEDSSLQEVFEGYRNAIGDKDLEDYKKFISSKMFKESEEFAAEAGKELDESFFKELAGNIIIFVPDKKYVTIENEVISGNTATWTLSETSPNHLEGDYIGTIGFVKEDGGWKVDSEGWEVSY